MRPGFWRRRKAAHTLPEAAKLAKEKKVRDETLAKYVLLSGNINGFQEPAAAPAGLVEVPDVVLAVQEAESRWHEKQIPAALDQHYTGGLKRPGVVKRKQIEVPAKVTVDKPEGWKESKKRKGEGGKPVTKGVAGFSNLSAYKEKYRSSLKAYKEKYRSLLKANGWGVGGRVMEVMPKWHNEWHSLKFKGQGQRNTPCMTILGLQKLLLILGSKTAVEFRDRVLECFNRVIAGDHTLIREIKANAAQDGPVQQIARVARADQAAEDQAVIEAVGQVVAPSGELVDLELAERRFELKRKTEDWGQSLKERQMTLEKQKLELADNLMESMQSLDPDWRADTWLQLHAKDLLCSTHIESRRPKTPGQVGKRQ
jgi:hypothetical protein